MQFYFFQGPYFTDMPKNDAIFIFQDPYYTDMPKNIHELSKKLPKVEFLHAVIVESQFFWLR
jgi:hypothetical protein